MDMNDSCSKFHNGTIIAGAVPVQLPENTLAKWVQFMHVEEGTQIFYGGEDVSLANGFGALEYKDTSERYPVFNTSQFWVVADEEGAVLRYMWGE